VDVSAISSFVATGDSFTEGMQDDLTPDGRFRGWADRVAAALAVHNGGLRYANLAIRGRLLDQVIEQQVPVATALTPDLVSFHAGANDVLRPRIDLAGLLHRYEATVKRLRSTGAEVLLFTVIGRQGWKGRTGEALNTRFTAFNDTARAAAEKYGCRVADMGSVEVLKDPRLWHEDRLHLSPAGHARVAAAVLEALGIIDPGLLGGPAGWWRAPLPDRPPVTWSGRGADLAGEVRWVRRYLAPWIVRRLRGVSSGDLITPKQVELIDITPA
jgi:lysophospholipase L1-like esterase